MHRSNNNNNRNNVNNNYSSIDNIYSIYHNRVNQLSLDRKLNALIKYNMILKLNTIRNKNN